MFLKNLGRNWKLLVTLIAPILLSTIPIYWNGPTGKEPYGAFVLLLMAIYWMTECIPLAVTSFLPVILYPLFGVVSTERITQTYLQDSLLFLLGGCVLALSFEYSNLHSRIALKVIMMVGARTSQLLLGIMGTTMFLSMWMNNTSTTAIIIPIVSAIMEELHKKMLENASHKDNIAAETEGTEMEPLRPNESSAALKEFENGISSSIREETGPSSVKREINEKIRNLRVMFLLGTAYASNIGGTGVITGSGTNVVALDLIRKEAEEPYTPEKCKSFLEISFVDWMVFNVPAMLLNTFLVWVYLQIYFLGIPNKWKFWKKKSEARELKRRDEKSLEKSIRQAIQDKYKALGPVRFHEMGVLVLFIIMVLLWVFKNPQIIPGWDTFFKKTHTGKSFIKEATPTFLIAMFMFFLPSKTQYYSSAWKGGLGRGLKDPLLKWDYVRDNFPWGVFLLLGGGSSMALGTKESGLNKWFGYILESSDSLKNCPNTLLLLLILFMITVCTTIASNTAVAAIVTPVLLSISYAKDLHPQFLVLAAASGASYAFVLPISTPPNCLVYTSSPDLKLKDMIFPGLAVSVFSMLVLFLTTITSSTWMLGFNEYNRECENMTLLAAAALSGK